MSHTRTTIFWPTQLREQIATMAKADHRSVSQQVVHLLTEALAARQHPRRLIDTRTEYRAGTVYPVEEPGTPPGGEGE